MLPLWQIAGSCDLSFFGYRILSVKANWAAANRATGTRNGEHET